MRANADACRTVDRAFGVVATDTAAVAADTALSWQGLAGAACAGRMGASAAGARAVGLAIGQAAGLFEVVATTSERLGIRVEELVVRVGAALARLFRKVLSRAAGPLGWASLATEVAVRGFDVVADVIADVEVVVDGLETLLALREEASAWAHAQSERVGVLLGLSERLGLP